MFFSTGMPRGFYFQAAFSHPRLQETPRVLHTCPKFSATGQSTVDFMLGSVRADLEICR